ncbi:unnamed protein product [Ostreobium quekettii]|uniref:Uncharacterized protein n=1 Tax=Ostreobium quekettii TaxID=121088 RepID=A0A8S1J9S5_9CHLO|nr:unnamed protein product [Ostreobium quekettii]
MGCALRGKLYLLRRRQTEPGACHIFGRGVPLCPVPHVELSPSGPWKRRVQEQISMSPRVICADGKHASDAESGEEDDWETQLEQGALKQSFGTVQGVGGEHELGQHRNVPRWSDVILGEDEELETEPGPACDPSKPRPRTTTAVARRLLAHALNKPELIARGEERELQVLRDRNKQARKDRREQLDSVWGEN